MFQPIKEVIERRIKEYGVKNKILLIEISDILKDLLSEILNEDNSSKARVISFEKRVLNIKIPNQKVRHRVYLEKERITNLLNKRLGEKLIKKVVFRT
jgi:hypothetical protein